MIDVSDGEEVFDKGGASDKGRASDREEARPPRWQEARKRSAGSVVTRVGSERVSLFDADARTLASDHLALTDLPRYETSAMDGWAVAGPGPWQVVGQVLAGSLRTEVLAAGTAVGIATGAVIPPNTLGVIRREHGTTSESNDQIWLAASAPEPNKDLRPAGEECSRGEVLGAAGQRVSPGLIGLLAAAGHESVEVCLRPSAGLLVFGDELLAAGLPRDGRVRDSLGPQIPAWLRRLGVELVFSRPVADTAQAHSEAIRAGLETVDVLFTTGGTAAGPVDHLHNAIADNGGEMVVDSVACRPGHPMLMAQFDRTVAHTLADGRRRKWLVGLPGNPQSAIVALMTLGQPLIVQLLGSEIAASEPVESVGAIRAPKAEDRLVPGALVGGRFEAADHLGSAMLRGLAGASGFAIVPPDGVAANELVRWLPLP